MNSRKTIAIMGGVMLLGTFTGASAQDDFRVLATPQQLRWVEIGPSLPGVQRAVVHGDPARDGAFVMRVRCPDGFRFPPHTHPVTEAVTVLSGTFHIGRGEEFDTNRLIALRTGGFMAMPRDSAHFGLCEGGTEIEIHANGPWATRILEAD